MVDSLARYFDPILDARWDPKDRGGWPLCGLINPEEAPGTEHVCPDCGTKWVKIVQFGKTVWSTEEMSKTPNPEGAGSD